MDILDEITANKRLEVAELKRRLPLSQLQSRVEAVMESNPQPSMAAALLASPTGIIAEFKRKSPSKGWIKEDGDASSIPLSYQRNGAAALSILADSKYFGGSPDFILKARESGVVLPILYKEFVVDEYQLYMARLCGASAVLLIAADLDRQECGQLIRAAHGLGLEVLLEMHSEAELEYAELEPDMCGINNRNLGTFVTDVSNSFRLAEKLPETAVKVSESGISSPETLAALRQCGFRGFLIGEMFMKEEDPGYALGQLIAAL
ncbi:MAG: indole-3-glycerol phosphate synthase TrpC [Bacteroidales bacterium]|nr:indole-3-glycerol phosphate synthase TrpC [Bacteroidales bacterium]